MKIDSFGTPPSRNDPGGAHDDTTRSWTEVSGQLHDPAALTPVPIG
jgi:hypothetical protein